MGLCLSRKKKATTGVESECKSPPPTTAAAAKVATTTATATAAVDLQKKQVVRESGKKEKEKKEKEEDIVCVGVTVVEEQLPRRSHKAVARESDDSCGGAGGGGAASAASVRTSSCTKEELDAILIQCGRLSRSSSGKAGGNGDGRHPRRYSGSKRSYDFDAQGRDFDDPADKSAATPVHRRASSRDRDGSGRRSHLKRSSSAGDEGRRIGGGDRRRASRSPRRRPETPTENGKRPSRMVSVPATASKRGMSASAATNQPHPKSLPSPRSRSPASNAAPPPPPQPSLSRSSSRKGEQSPYRRNPMGEIDDSALNIRANSKTAITTNKAPPNNLEALTFQQSQVTHSSSLHSKQKSIRVCLITLLLSDLMKQRSNKHVVAQIQRSGERKLDASCGGSEGSSAITSKGIREQLTSYKEASKMVESNNDVAEAFNPLGLTRSRSQRKSRDLDLLLNSSAIASMLIEDGQNLAKHEAIMGFTLPACVSKACSILEAVADLNSCANSTLSAASTGGRNTPEHSERTLNSELNGGLVRDEASKMKKSHLFLESEVGLDRNDLMEPSLHKYVTVRGGVDMEQQESAGSNSFFLLANGGEGASVSSSWEPNSADSTDRWTKADQQHFMTEYDVPSNSNSEEAAGGRRRTEGAADEINTPASGSNRPLKVNNQNTKLGARPTARRSAAIA